MTALPSRATSSASILLQPTAGPPTSTVVVVGTGFGPSEQVSVSFGKDRTWNATADGSGSFNRRIRIPEDARPGRHTVNAIGQSSGLSASAGFLVRTDWPKFQFDLSDSGFNPYENVLGPLNVSRLNVDWSFPTGPDAVIHSSPAVVGGVAYFGSTAFHAGTFYAVGAHGVELWSFPTQSVVYSVPAVASGIVYFADGFGIVYALDTGTGKQVWTFSARGSIYASPAVAHGRVYIGSYDGNLYALNASTGALQWSHPFGDYIQSAPAIVGGVVYCASVAGRILALSAKTGSELWSLDLGTYTASTPAVVDGVLYVGSAGRLWALDAASGQQLWSAPGGSTPAIANGVVYAGTANGLYALRASDGEQRWHSKVGTSGVQTPAVANGVVYVESSNKIFALDAATGSRVWSTGIAIADYGSPVVVNGALYAGSYDGNLYVFDLKSRPAPGSPTRGDHEERGLRPDPSRPVHLSGGA